MLFQNKLRKMIIILLVIFTTLVVGICLIKNKKKEGRVAEVPTPDESGRGNTKRKTKNVSAGH